MRQVVVPLALVGVMLAASVPLVDAVNVSVAPLFKLQQVATGLNNALLVTHAGDASGRVFVVRQTGQVHSISSGGVVDLWFDLSSRVLCCGERGLLGLAFHPNFEGNGVFFASYTRSGDGASVLEKFTMSNPLTGKPSLSQGQVLLTWPQPFTNHNGGGIQFGPDGYLYYALGDGGAGGDPGNRAQNNNDLLGKMLRLDVNVPSGYAIPDGNPFKNGGGRPEIWAKGLRNPWRWSFDRATGDLWIADVGQNFVEEINFQPAGAAGGRNYGWRAWEGHYPYTPGEALPLLSTTTFPVYEYAHGASQGFFSCSVTGGYVYRGAAIPALQGMYLFGDYCSGLISVMPAAAAAAGADVAVPAYQLNPPNGRVLGSFGEDEAGELYVPQLNGIVNKIVPLV